MTTMLTAPGGLIRSQVQVAKVEPISNGKMIKIVTKPSNINCEEQVLPVMGNNLSLPTSNFDSDSGEAQDIPSPLPGDEYVLYLYCLRFLICFN